MLSMINLQNIINNQYSDSKMSDNNIINIYFLNKHTKNIITASIQITGTSDSNVITVPIKHKL